MAGEHQCHYSGWFRSHFSFKAQKRDHNLDAWTAEHTAMVHDCASDFRAEGYEVYLEGQNSIRVRGSGGAVLVGKPDIVAVQDDTAVIVECKTGQPKTGDSIQVRLYMYLLSEWSTHPAKECRRVLGEVRYQPDRGVPHAADDGVADLIRRYAGVSLPYPAGYHAKLSRVPFLRVGRWGLYGQHPRGARSRGGGVVLSSSGVRQVSSER